MVGRSAQRGIDEAFMARALRLAEKWRGRTSPNPIVGCVIVDRGGNIIAEGAHRGPGRKHAERDALDKLGGSAAGGTMYVTLEPCTHTGRTPPCAPAVIASRVARVVVGSEDPFPGHGGGIRDLKRAGITVARAHTAACDAANRPFFRWVQSGRPAITLKAAITLDGKIATATGQSQWITGELARRDAHQLRATHDAILVGIGTVIADDPRLTSRILGGRDPVRVVLDTALRTPLNARLLPKRRGPRTIIATGENAPTSRATALANAGAEIWRFRVRRDGTIPLGALARRLGSQGILSLLVEGGAEVHASLLDQHLVDQLVLYIAPKVIGGRAPSWVAGSGVANLAAAYGFFPDGAPRQLGADLRYQLLPTL